MPSDLTTIPLSVPNFSGREAELVQQCLDSGWVSTAGPWVSEFEQKFAARIGVAHAVACVNGTSALHLILHAWGIGPGECVLVSDLTFIASANAIRYTGARPIFIDADESRWQMNPERVRDFLVGHTEQINGICRLKSSGERVAAIMPVHILGVPVDMDPVLELADEFDLPVVEDATESLGATYKDQAVGTIGAASAFSFNGNKLITTGGGGMVCTNDGDLAAKVRHLSTQAKQDALEFIHDEVGFNYRLTSVQAAMGIGQLEQLDKFLARKSAVAEKYRAAFAGLAGFETLPEPEDSESARWLFTIRIRGESSRPLMQHLDSRAIQSRPLWQPMHLSPAMADLNPEPCPVSATLNRECLSLPCSTNITDADVDRVIAEVVEWATSRSG